MYTILIADRDPVSRKIIRDRLNKSTDVRIIVETVNLYQTARMMTRIEPDVIFLDSCFLEGEPSGILHNIPHDPRIIILAPDGSFATKAFDNGALDYLVKPICIDRLAYTFRKIFEIPLSNSGVRDTLLPYLFVANGNGFTRIESHQIRYIKAARDYSVLYTEGREWISSIGIGKLVQRLDQCFFKRVHRSYIVNLSWIERVERTGPHTSLVMKEGPEIIVSKSYLPVIKAILL